MYIFGWGAVGAAIGYVAYETLLAAVIGGLLGVGCIFLLNIIAAIILLKWF